MREGDERQGKKGRDREGKRDWRGSEEYSHRDREIEN